MNYIKPKTYRLHQELISYAGSGTKPSPKPEPAKKRASTLIGYSLPWTFWKLKDGEVKGLAEVMAHWGLTATLIEMDLWTDQPEKVLSFVKRMREKDITTEIVIVNGNSLELFHNNDTWFNKMVDGLIEVVGIQKVIFQPICEPGNRGGDLAKAARWMKYAYEKLWAAKAQTAVGDHWDLCKPYHGKTSYIEKHHCSDPNAANLIAGINTTDCGATGGMNPDRAYKAAKAAIQKKTNFILYDLRRDGNPAPNWALVEAIGRAIQES